MDNPPRFLVMTSWARVSRCLPVIAFLAGATGPARAAQVQPSEPPAIAVMTFNIRYGTADDGENSWPYRRELVFDVIREQAPDILGVQEALRFQLDELRAAFPEYAKIGVGRDDGLEIGEFSAVLYRAERFEVADYGTFWFSETPDVPSIAVNWGARLPRVCSWARLVEKESGRAFYVYNVHFSSRSREARERSAELLVDRIADRSHSDPVIVTGDFNSGEDNPAMLYLKGEAEPLPPLSFRDSFRVLYPSATDVGTFNGFKGRSTGEKIDAILVSPGWKIESAAIISTSRSGRYPSDHFPVVAELRMP